MTPATVKTTKPPAAKLAMALPEEEEEEEVEKARRAKRLVDERKEELHMMVMVTNGEWDVFVPKEMLGSRLIYLRNDDCCYQVTFEESGLAHSNLIGW